MSTDSTATLRALDEGYEATQSLTLPYRGPAPSTKPLKAASQKFANSSNILVDPTKIFRTHVITTYKTDRLGSKSWSCQVCGKGATKVYHSAASLLSPLGSSLVDELIFTCNAPRCSNHGSDLADHFGRYQIPEATATSCENCDRKSNVKLCSGCTFSYGSRTGRSNMIGHQKKPRNRRAKSQQGLRNRQLDPIVAEQLLLESGRFSNNDERDLP
ncbi:hypothetical protein IFR04_007099 [Cadophora malorum]|uniref:Uncharacterized protein n=1 Tax=Cadophora malorum TaxID=108018 RepID=A0A8H7WB49_9HELO|nr:hypothetical protein IFR04_007099 [Cadophora malorum]